MQAEASGHDIANWEGGDWMRKPPSPELRRALLEVVNNQLRDGTPPETGKTLERLIATGHTREQAIELIACVVSCEIFDVLKSRKPYNQVRYISALQALPRLPWEAEG
jgi:hypothetical protein